MAVSGTPGWNPPVSWSTGATAVGTDPRMAVTRGSMPVPGLRNWGNGLASTASAWPEASAGNPLSAQLPPVPFPMVTWVPVVRQQPVAGSSSPSSQGVESVQRPVQPPGVPESPSSLAQTEPDEPDSTAARQESSAVPPNSEESQKSAPELPETPAERTGRQVGEMVTRLLEENPQWQRHIETLNLDNLDQGLDQARELIGPWARLLPRNVEQRLLSRLDPGMRPMAQQALAWLKQESPGAMPVEPMEEPAGKRRFRLPLGQKRRAARQQAALSLTA